MLRLCLILSSVGFFAIANGANMTIPFSYPLFAQCDEKWADDLMDTKTICDVGCLMSSTAMGLAGIRKYMMCFIL